MTLKFLHQMKVKKNIVIIFLFTFLPLSLLCQRTTIEGKVIYAGDNQPLIGVTIMVKGSSVGTTTDVNGNYSLRNISSDATLVFSFIGMETQEISVANQTTLNVTMSEGAF